MLQFVGSQSVRQGLATEQQLVVRIQCFHCWGLDSIPGWGTKILQAVWNSHKKKKKKKKKVEKLHKDRE